MISIDELNERLTDESAEIRRQAVMEIPRLDPTGAIDLLLLALGDSDWRVRKEAAAVASKLADNDTVIDALISATEDDENIGLRNAALNALSVGGQKAVGAVIERTALPNPDVRKTAVDIIGLSRDPRAVAVLSQSLADADANVQAAAAEWLGEYPGDASVDALLSCFHAESNLLTLVALQSLEKLGATIPWDHISPLLRDPLLSESIVPTLGASGSKEAIGEVLGHLTSDPDACLAMTRLHDTDGELEALVEKTFAGCDSDVHDALWRWIETEEGDRQKAAIRCMAWMKRPASIPHIIDLARNCPYYPLLVDELEKWGPLAIDKLQALLETETGHRLASVVGLLYRLLDDTSGRRVSSAFEALLTSEHSAVATAAASAAARFGERSAIPKLVALIGSENDRIRNAAGTALQELGDRFPDAVRSAVRNEPIRGAAGVQLCRVLERVGSRSEAPAVSAALTAPENALRRSAVKTLGRILGPDAAEAVGSALGDPDLGVRMAAVEALAHIGTAAADTIANAIESAAGPVVPALVRALGRVGHPNATAILAEACLKSEDIALAAIEAAEQLSLPLGEVGGTLLRHDDKEVVKAAMKLFGARIDGDALVQLLVHPEWDVRLNAVSLIEKGAPLPAPLVSILEERLNAEDNDLVRSAIADRLEELKES